MIKSATDLRNQHPEDILQEDEQQKRAQAWVDDQLGDELCIRNDEEFEQIALAARDELSLSDHLLLSEMVLEIRDADVLVKVVDGNIVLVHGSTRFQDGHKPVIILWSFTLRKYAEQCGLTVQELTKRTLQHELGHIRGESDKSMALEHGY